MIFFFLEGRPVSGVVHKFKCPLKKTQPFCPCSRVLNWTGKGLMDTWDNVKHKGKVIHHRMGHEGPEGEQRYCSTLSLTSAMDGGGWPMPHNGCFTPRAQLDGCGKSHLQQESIPRQPRPLNGQIICTDRKTLSHSGHVNWIVVWSIAINLALKSLYATRLKPNCHANRNFKNGALTFLSESAAANPRASNEVNVLLPTPPLPDKTRILYFTDSSLLRTSSIPVSKTI